jgi:glutamate-ammonia-ligase adenylyltransferase
MSNLHHGLAAADWPLPADIERVERERERFLAASRDADPPIADFGEALAADRDGARLLAAVFGNSPYLTECLTQDLGFARDLLQRGPDAGIEAVLKGLRHARTEPAADTPTLMSSLRFAKRRAALTIALADIAGLWPLERVTQALSDFADLAIDAAVAHLLREAAASGAWASWVPASSTTPATST